MKGKSGLQGSQHSLGEGCMGILVLCYGWVGGQGLVEEIGLEEGQSHPSSEAGQRPHSVLLSVALGNRLC